MNPSGAAFLFGASQQRGGERKPVDVIINDQLEHSVPAGSLMIESQVNINTKPCLESGLLERRFFRTSANFELWRA